MFWFDYLYVGNFLYLFLSHDVMMHAYMWSAWDADAFVLMAL